MNKLPHTTNYGWNKLSPVISAESGKIQTILLLKMSNFSVSILPMPQKIFELFKFQTVFCVIFYVHTGMRVLVLPAATKASILSNTVGSAETCTRHRSQVTCHRVPRLSGVCLHDRVCCLENSFGVSSEQRRTDQAEHLQRWLTEDQPTFYGCHVRKSSVFLK